MGGLPYETDWDVHRLAKWCKFWIFVSLRVLRAKRQYFMYACMGYDDHVFISLKPAHCMSYLCVFKGRISRFSACPYTDWPVHAFWHRPKFFIVYEPIMSKLPNFACKLP